MDKFHFLSASVYLRQGKQKVKALMEVFGDAYANKPNDLKNTNLTHFSSNTKFSTHNVLQKA